jgi:hypothetical protein
LPRTSEQSQHGDQPAWKAWATTNSVSINADFGRMTLETAADPEPNVAGSKQTGDGSWVGTENDNKGKEILCPSCSMTFSRGSDLERHHKTVHLNDGTRPYKCLVIDCPADVKSWTTANKLRLHEKTWHNGDSNAEKSRTNQVPQATSQPEADMPVAFYTSSDYSHSALNTYSPPTEYYAISTPTWSHNRTVTTKDSERTKDKLDPSESCH